MDASITSKIRHLIMRHQLSRLARPKISDATSPHQLPCNRVHRRLVIIRREQMPITIHRYLKTTMSGKDLYIVLVLLFA